MKGSWGSGLLLTASSALATALAGRHWWAVTLTLLSALGMTYGAVCWLASRPNSASIKIGPIEWRAASDHQARDALKHFDDYSLGVGNLQQPTIRKQRRAADEELAQQYRIEFEYIDNDPPRPRIRIGPHLLDLGAAGRAASLVVYEIWAAVMTDEGRPVSRQAIAAFLR